MRFVPQLTGIVPYAAGTPIEVVAARYRLDKVIKLASNESPLPPFPEVLQAIQQKFTELNRYPDSECRELKAALAARYGARPEEVIIGNGSCELILWLSLIFLEPGTEAVFSDPTFLMYEEVTQARGATAVRGGGAQEAGRWPAGSRGSLGSSTAPLQGKRGPGDGGTGGGGRSTMTAPSVTPSTSTPGCWRPTNR